MAPRQPVYIETARSGRLEETARMASEKLSDCTLCPRQCRVNRTAGETGFCRTGEQAVVASWNSHFGEEAPLTGRNGSGTIFFSHCNLLCLFCQNYDISHNGYGEAVPAESLADMMLSLQSAGCHNINFVTPSHVVPQIIAAVQIATTKGLHIPLVYNTGGYDRVETLELLNGIIDIYMPDFKFWDAQVATKTCQAPDYPVVVRQAIIEMHRQVGDLITSNGIAQRGLLIRHLVLPNDLAGTEAIMKFIAEQISRETYVNIMAQYRPCGRAQEIPDLAAPLGSDEYQAAYQSALSFGLSRIDKPRRIFMLG